MTSEDIRTNIHLFIRKNFIFDEQKNLVDHESLLGSGVIDSTGVLELISFLEERFGIKFEDKELVADNFDSVSKITIFISTKISQSIAA